MRKITIGSLILAVMVVFLLVNLIVDLLYGFIDPRIRASYK